MTATARPPTGGEAPAGRRDPSEVADDADDADDRPALARWWSGLGRGQQALLAVLAAVVVTNLALAGARSMVGGDPGGPASSSFSTGDDGLEALADLLRAEGHPVARVRDTPTASDLPVAATAVVADPQRLGAAEAELLARFVAGGGRLVLGGERSAELVEGLTASSIGWSGGDPARRVAVWLPVPEAGGARSLAGDGGGRWDDPGPLLPVAGADGRPSVLVGPVGRGTLIALADTGPLRNADLDEGDNAAFAVAAVGGEPGAPVVFVESVHGFAASGLDALPSSWKWAAAGLLVALLAGLWSAGARLGPPEPSRRELRPRRRAHVDAVAAALDRATPSAADAAAPLQAQARAALAAHLGVAPDASPSVLRAAADGAGVDPTDVAVLVEPAGDLDRALAVGALAARHRRAVLGVADRLGGAPPPSPDPSASATAAPAAPAASPPGARS